AELFEICGVGPVRLADLLDLCLLIVGQRDSWAKSAKTLGTRTEFAKFTVHGTVKLSALLVAELASMLVGRRIRRCGRTRRRSVLCISRAHEAEAQGKDR